MVHRFEFFALRTLRGKFLALIVPFVLLSTIVVFGISELGARRHADQKLRAKLDELIEIQSAVLSEPLWTVNNHQVELVLIAIAIDPDVLGAIAYDQSNNPVASVGAVEALERQEFFAKRDINHGGRDDRQVIGHLALALTNARIRAESGTRLLDVVGLGALLLLSVVTIALVANRRTIGIPLEQLLKSINQSRESGERMPVDWTSRDEIGEVVTAFNEMQTRQQAYETELHAARDDLELRVEKRTKELAESQELLDTILDNIPAHIFLRDLEGRYQFINARYAQVYGVTKEQAVGKEIHEVLPKKNADIFLKHDKKVIRELKVVEHDVYLDENGAERIFSAIKFPVLGESKNVTSVGGFSLEVTDHRRAEEALRQSEQRLQSILESSPIGTTILNRDGTFEFANSRMAQMLELTKEQFLATRPGDFYVNPKEFEMVTQRLQKEGRLRDVELQLKKSDGTPFWVLLSFESTRLKGGQQYCGWVYDISELRRSEEERLSQAHKMEILGQLTGGVAHDFNNVLTVLDCNIGLLKSQNSGQGQQNGLINDCLEAIAMGTNLTNRLTSFARKEPVAKTTIDLNTLITGFRDLLNRSVGKDISVEFMLPADTLPVLAEASLVEVALLNLAMNAHDAMPEGGKITVSADKTIIDNASDTRHSKDDQRPYAVLQVCDTGTGMPPEIRDRAFEAFFTTKDKRKGTGLGLSSVQDLAQSAGGFVEIESELKKGTTVKIYLPLHESDNTVMV